MRFIINGCTDKGTIRERNEDKFGFLKTDYGLTAVVCDGMGGYKGGDIAAQIVVNSVLNHFNSFPDNFDLHDEVFNFFTYVNKIVTDASKEQTELAMMGTTIALLIIFKDKFVTAHLGDSRIYLIRNKTITQLTKDHTRIQELIDHSGLTFEEALQIAEKNVVTRALGINELSRPDISSPEKIIEGDIFVLCTDGLTNFVNDNEIVDLVSEFSPETASEQLIYLANLRGSDDNVTSLIIKAEAD